MFVFVKRNQVPGDSIYEPLTCQKVLVIYDHLQNNTPSMSTSDITLPVEGGLKSLRREVAYMV